jgi:hypothetical protein
MWEGDDVPSGLQSRLTDQYQNMTSIHAPYSRPNSHPAVYETVEERSYLEASILPALNTLHRAQSLESTSSRHYLGPPLQMHHCGNPLNVPAQVSNLPSLTRTAMIRNLSQHEHCFVA